MAIDDYKINECDETRWYELSVYSSGIEEKYVLRSSQNIEIDSNGHVISFNGCGRTREGFNNSKFKLYAVRCWDKGKEEKVLKELEELICEENTRILNE